MFTKTETDPTPLNLAIARAYASAETTQVGTPEYDAILESISKLNKLQSQTAPDKISKDTLAMIGANLAGICLIISHERAHVVTTKALGFVSKLR